MQNSDLSYSGLWVHRVMLRDSVRCETFRKAILETVKPGNVVLDVGAGTGILSLFAVQAGAKKVYAVERSNIAEFTRKVLRKNGAEDCVEVIQADMENVKLTEKVDLIVSEWLGGYGVDSGMLAPLLVARDRWLKKNGKILPQRVTAWMAPIWDSTLDSDMRFWRGHPYGVDLSSMADGKAQEMLMCQMHLSEDNSLSEPQQMWTTDVYNFSTENARAPFKTSLSFLIKREGKFSALSTWFQAEFDAGLILTNEPGAPQTHWGQYVFPLEHTIKVKSGTKIEVEFTCEPKGNKDFDFSQVRCLVRVGDEP
ncbi:50S ribosomal protein L11 methyltransferase [Candidatus Omnitrophota bacterium]